MSIDLVRAARSKHAGCCGPLLITMQMDRTRMGRKTPRPTAARETTLQTYYGGTHQQPTDHISPSPHISEKSINKQSPMHNRHTVFIIYPITNFSPRPLVKSLFTFFILFSGTKNKSNKYLPNQKKKKNMCFA